MGAAYKVAPTQILRGNAMANYQLKTTANTKITMEMTHVSPNTGDWSYSFWVTKDYSSSEQLLVLISNLFTVYPRMMVYVDDYGHVVYVASGTGAATISVTGTSDITDGIAHLVTVTMDRDSVSGMRLYVDGALEGTPADATTVSAYDFSFVSCMEFLEANALPHYLLGDDFRFYKGLALSALQVALIYNSGRGCKVVEPNIEMLVGLSAFWYTGFDDATGTTVSGRYLDGDTWIDSDGVLEAMGGVGVVVYELGGVPFGRIVANTKTLASLLARVKQLVGRTGTDSANLDLTGIIIDAFNDGLIRIVKECPNIPELQVKDVDTLETATDEYEYALNVFDPPIAHLKSHLWILDDDSQYLVEFMELNKFDELYPDVSAIASGIPNKYTVRGSVLEFNCPVSADYTGLPIRVDYTQFATPFDDDDMTAQCEIVNADRGLILLGWSEALRTIAKGDATMLQVANEKLELFGEWLHHFGDYHDMQTEETVQEDIIEEYED
jgi:hypothetical protein